LALAFQTWDQLALQLAEYRPVFYFEICCRTDGAWRLYSEALASEEGLWSKPTAQFEGDRTASQKSKVLREVTNGYLQTDARTL
jgi:hypothetical protein